MGYKILAGRYEIHEKIGDGGMAVVYKARDKLLDRMVAIKILRPEYVKDTTFVENFRSESMNAAKLDTHPNVVTIYDVGKDGGIYYIVMELVDGKPLNEIISERGPLDYREVVHLAIQIASALSHAHKHHTIHRDVKPHNILVAGEGEDEVAKITDFGIARAVTDRTTVSDAGVIMGSVHYFSPEQGRGQYVDEKSDIYSLGIVLYEMLTGRVPFDAENPVAIALMHMNEPIVPPSQIVKRVPPGLEQIILKATEKYQVNRFRSVEEMLDALKHISYITGVDDVQEIRQPVRTPVRPPEPEKQFDADPEIFEILPDDEPEIIEDDEDDAEALPIKDRKKPISAKEQKHRRNVILAAIAAVVLALVLGFLLFSGVNALLGGNKVDVPDLTNMSLQSAQAALEKAGFTLEQTEGVHSDVIAKDQIVKQDPRGGLKAKKNSVVRVTLSLGPEDKTVVDTILPVPDLTGKTRADAEYTAKQAGFTIGNITYADSDKTIDTVVDQMPKYNESAKKDSKIDITLSQGPRVKEVEMPNLIGKSEADARTALEGLRLIVGTVETGNSSDYAQGVVMWQQFQTAAKLTEGQTVNLKISLGPDERESTVKLTVDFSGAPADMFKFSVLQISADGSQNYLIRNQDRYQSQGSEDIDVTGKGMGKVIVYFNDTQSKVFNIDFSTGKVS